MGLQRMGKMLLQDGNYYAQLFSDAERKLCADIQNISVQHVMQFIATHMHSKCANSLFTNLSKTSEQLREISKHGFRTRRTRVYRRDHTAVLSLTNVKKKNTSSKHCWQDGKQKQHAASPSASPGEPY